MPSSDAPGSSANPFVDISQAQDVPSGVYWFDLQGVAPFRAEVDNSNGGGWILVLNYVHEGGTNPELRVRTTDLPISTNAALGSDESGTAAWGHAGNSLFAAMDADEVRYYAESTGSDRVIHFRTFQGIEYFETGTGGIDLDAMLADYTALDGHTSNLPATATHTYTDGGTKRSPASRSTTGVPTTGVSEGTRTAGRSMTSPPARQRTPSTACGCVPSIRGRARRTTPPRTPPTTSTVSSTWVRAICRALWKPTPGSSWTTRSPRST